jgi:hypothetical protein
VVECAESVPELEWRRDIGELSYLQGLSSLLAG